MNVTLLGHTRLSKELIYDFEDYELTVTGEALEKYPDVSHGQVIALGAIRQCYSHKTALEVLETESEKYFGDKGKEGNRLFKQIVSSGHTSTLEHIHFTFAVETVSRNLMAQETRHRHKSYSIQSQRYVNFKSDGRSEGFDYVTPPTIFKNLEALKIYINAMEYIQSAYDQLIALKVPQEDARFVLPGSAATNMVVSFNLRTLLEYYAKRRKGNGAQWEIADLAEKFKQAVIEVEPWTKEYFEVAK